MMIAKSPTLPIQEAFFERATNDPELAALGATVHDEPPEGAPRPYVIVGEAPFITVPDNTHSGFGWRTTITLGTWIEERGYKLGHQIQDRLIALFNRRPLDLFGFHVVTVKHEMDLLTRDPNPRLRHLQVRFIVQTEQLREES